MSKIPKETTLDNSIELLREGFPYIQNRVLYYQSDLFKTRLMGEKVICIHGPEAAQIFYDPEKFQRTGAVPKRVQKTLLGENGVQTMDGCPHRHRKAAFMSLMTPESIQQLLKHAARFWKAYSNKWKVMTETVLFEDAQEIMCLAACAWANVPLPPTKVRQRAADFTAMVDAFGGIGPRHWRGRKARARAEKWIQSIVNQVRKGKLEVAEGSPLYVMAWHRDAQGELLSRQMAAVEIINLLRPVTAISWYVTYAALAMHQYPECRQKLQTEGEKYTDLFVQEVRRFYPFAPFLGARVRSDFEWKNYHFKEGTLVLLDVYGMQHDPEIWDEPEQFKPERFMNRNISAFDFIPQGGGFYDTGHRCAGEQITVELTRQAVNFLANCVSYDVPEQDLSFSLSRMPAYPQSGFVIKNVKQTSGTLPKPKTTSGCPFHQTT